MSSSINLFAFSLLLFHRLFTIWLNVVLNISRTQWERPRSPCPLVCQEPAPHTPKHIQSATSWHIALKKNIAIIPLYPCQHNEKVDFFKIDQTSFNIQKSNLNPVVQWDQTMLISTNKSHLKEFVSWGKRSHPCVHGSVKTTTLLPVSAGVLGNKLTGKEATHDHLTSVNSVSLRTALPRGILWHTTQDKFHYFLLLVMVKHYQN